ncbi:MAG: lysophospholipid acyltransferase family protein [Candidatus Cloacimonetes bacterium]|nr:lysophospholipid acyltransferase family protein [Candidatus Cloacimonadota bacterium]
MPRKLLRSRTEYVAFYLTYAVLRILPYSFAAWLLTQLTVFTGMRLGLRRKLVHRNMHRVFPDWTEHRLKSQMRAHYRHVGLTLSEIYLTRGDQLVRRVRPEGWENIEKALALGRGVIVMSAHQGNWELCGRYMARRGLTLQAYIKHQRNPWFDRFTWRLRASAGIGQIFTSQSLRPVLRSLRNNEIVVFLADQYAGKEGVRMSFLDSDASVHTGPVRVALRTGSPIVFTFGMRNPDGSHILSFDEPIFPQSGSGDDADVDKLTRRLADRMEERIRACPSQWLWMHNRWKNPTRARPQAKG